MQQVLLVCHVAGDVKQQKRKKGSARCRKEKNEGAGGEISYCAPSPCSPRRGHRCFGRTTTGLCSAARTAAADQVDGTPAAQRKVEQGAECHAHCLACQQADNRLDVNTDSLHVVSPPPPPLPLFLLLPPRGQLSRGKRSEFISPRAAPRTSHAAHLSLPIHPPPPSPTLTSKSLKRPTGTPLYLCVCRVRDFN